jgi:hypothetical protein
MEGNLWLAPHSQTTAQVVSAYVHAQRENADAQLTQNDGVHDEIFLVGVNQSTTLLLGTGFVGSLSTFPSTR